MSLTTAEVGSEVALIEPWGWNTVRITQKVVDRAGKNFLQIGTQKFTRNGGMYGGSYRSSRIEIWDESKHPARIEATNAELRLTGLRRKLHDFQWNDVDLETAEAVLALLKPKVAA